MRLLVPHYSLRDGLIVPTVGKPAKELETAGRLWPNPGEPWDLMATPPVLAEFLSVDASDEQAILRFCNTYGTLGARLWSPFHGALAVAEGAEAEAVSADLAAVERLRLGRILGLPGPTAEGPVCDIVSACLADPSLFTLSRWLAESVTDWRAAQKGLGAMRRLAADLALHLGYVHGGERGKVAANADHWRAVSLRETAHELGQVYGWRAEPGADSFEVALQLFDLVLARVSTDGAWSVVPRGNRFGAGLGQDTRCLLHHLHLLSCLSSVLAPRAKCALPTCTAPAEPGGRYCSLRHANLFRQQKKRAGAKLGLSPAQVEAMVELVKGGGFDFDEAAQRVLHRRKARVRAKAHASGSSA